MIEKLKTGITGFDFISMGGLPKNRAKSMSLLLITRVCILAKHSAMWLAFYLACRLFSGILLEPKGQPQGIAPT